MELKKGTVEGVGSRDTQCSPLLWLRLKKESKNISSLSKIQQRVSDLLKLNKMFIVSFQGCKNIPEKSLVSELF